MKFGVREICDVVLKAKAAQNSGTDTVQEVKAENIEKANDNTDIKDKEEK